MAAFIGKLAEYDVNSEWDLYNEQLEQLFVANEVKEAKKVAILLASIGQAGYKLFRDLCSPELPKNKTYDELVQLMKNHQQPKPIVTAERFRFGNLTQGESESVNNYILKLKAGAEHCEYGQNLNDALRDQFIRGLRAENVQRHLLSVQGLTFSKAVEIAHSMETAAKEAKSFHDSCSTASTAAVNKLSGQKKTFTYDNYKKKVQRGTKDGTIGINIKPRQCFACGSTEHIRDNCKFKGAECYNCHKRGHVRSFCHAPSSVRHTEQKKSDRQTSSAQYQRSTHRVVGDDDIIVPFHRCITDAAINSIVPAVYIPLIVQNITLDMEVDSGSSLTLIDEECYSQNFANIKMEQTAIKLRSYTGELLPLCGYFPVIVEFRGKKFDLRLYVVHGRHGLLLGRDWLQEFGVMDWLKDLRNYNAEPSTKEVSIESDISRESAQVELERILRKYSTLFQGGIGCCKNIELHIPVDGNHPPIFLSTRNPPLALLDKMDKEINRLEQAGVIERVQHSNWATPVTPVEKSDGSVKLAGMYNLTVNKALPKVVYPLPRFENIIATLAGGEEFSTYDMSDAYNQFALDEASQSVMTINTHRGLFKVKRLFYGVACAPALFQQAIEQLVKQVPRTQPFLDDVCNTGRTKKEHLKIIERILSIFLEHNLRLNFKKCKFLQKSVQFLGHIFSKDGYAPIPSRITALASAAKPDNADQLHSYLGMINYYARFLPGCATILEPLYGLLRQDVTWDWRKEHDKSFFAIQELLQNTSFLVHFDPKRPTVLTVDASPWGVGAILSHEDSNGYKYPISSASGLLNKAQRNYSQIDKEALAIVFGLKKFHHYLYGHSFILETDHKPLVSIFGEKRGKNEIVAARLQRWSVFLNAYNFKIRYISTKDNQVADGLSRTAVETIDFEDDLDTIQSVFQVQLQSTPLSAEDIKKEMKTDTTLKEVMKYLQTGWPKEGRQIVLSYYRVRDKLSIAHECLFFAERIVIPTVLREHLLTELHAGHPGVVRMKALARTIMWWPNINSDIEQRIRGCEACQVNLPMPAREQNICWPVPSEVWGRLHLDFAGPCFGHMFLLGVDAKSKWPEVVIMKSTTSRNTILELKDWFVRNGLPLHVHTDGGPQFRSDEFRTFLAINGIRQSVSPPYHPATNGAVEGFVGTFKKTMKKLLQEGQSLGEALNQFLFTYRTTPHVSTGVPPAQLFRDKVMRTRLHLLLPRPLEEQVPANIRRSFQVGDFVFARDYRSSTLWIPGEITEQLSPVTFAIRLHNGIVWKRHVEQLRIRHVKHILRKEREVLDDFVGPTQEFPVVEQDPGNDRNEANAAAEDDRNEATPAPEDDHNEVIDAPVDSGRPQRIRRRPQYLNDYV